MSVVGGTDFGAVKTVVDPERTSPPQSEPGSLLHILMSRLRAGIT